MGQRGCRLSLRPLIWVNEGQQALEEQVWCRGYRGGLGVPRQCLQEVYLAFPAGGYALPEGEIVQGRVAGTAAVVQLAPCPGEVLPQVAGLPPERLVAVLELPIGRAQGVSFLTETALGFGRTAEERELFSARTTGTTRRSWYCDLETGWRGFLTFGVLVCHTEGYFLGY